MKRGNIETHSFAVFVNNLPTILKIFPYVINPDEEDNIETHFLAVFVNNDNAKHFDDYIVEHILK